MLDNPRIIDLDEPGVGYHSFHPDLSLNFQCNRWLQWIGTDAFDDIAAVANAATSYPDWIDEFLAAAERVGAEGRGLASAYFDRAAEFFMNPDDPRKATTRARFVGAMQRLYEVTPDRVPFEGAWLPAYDLAPVGPPSGQDIVVFGGFDSYIEEFLPLLMAIAELGHRVVAFDGPGQGGALEEAGVVLTAEWERPVAAILDHYGLSDVTAVGVSMGGGLVIRAAAFEPRIRRAVAWDIFTDELDVLGGQIGPGVSSLVRLGLTFRARPIINFVAGRASARRPVSQWGLQQGMHIVGAGSPYEFLSAARGITTRSVSGRVTADVLLLAGADDHYVPIRQLDEQAHALTSARSVTTRVFTASENASNHCQIGDVGACVRFILAWVDSLAHTKQVNSSGA